MAKFRATVRVTELEGPDLANVQRTLDERMKEAGFPKWKVVSIETEGAMSSRRREVRAARRRRRSEGWGLFFVAAGAWAVWFFWLLVD